MTHLIDGEFQSDKYPTTPRGKVPLSVKDATAQDLLWEYAQRRRTIDTDFADDLEQALKLAGFVPSGNPIEHLHKANEALAEIALLALKIIDYNREHTPQAIIDIREIAKRQLTADLGKANAEHLQRSK